MEHARLTGDVDRVLCVQLSEAEWKAFLASTPQPIHWLKERIQEAIEVAKKKPVES